MKRMNRFSKAKLLDITRRFSSSGEPIAVLGDVMLDEFQFGRVIGHSREDLRAEELDIERVQRMLGGAGNVAANLKALGGEVELHGVTGFGHTYRLLMDLLRDEKVESNLVADTQRSTTHKVRAVDAASGRIISVTNRQHRTDIPDSIVRGILERLESSKAKIVIISDYGRGVVTPNLLTGIAEMCRSREFTIILDVRDRQLRYYASIKNCVFLVTPNMNDLAALMSAEVINLDNVKTEAKMLSRELGCNVLVTLGAQGVLLFKNDNEGDIWELPALAEPSKVKDVAGAGDTVVAVIAKSLQAGASLPEACALACFGSAVVVEKSGTAVCGAEELAERVTLHEGVEG